MIQWGIIGAGNIAQRFAQSLEKTDRGTLYAVANRTLEKSEAFQKKFPCEKIYDDYNNLIKDENVQIVYISLPHLFHYDWVKAALLNDKSVLCEKPATMNASQMKEVKQIAQERKILFMEAMKNRYVPVYSSINELVSTGQLGKIQSISTTLCKEIPEECTTYHYLPDQGGCLLDLGVYNVGFLEGFLKEPLEIENIDYVKGINDVEVYVKANLKNTDFSVVIESGFDRSKPVQAIIVCDKGSIVVPDFHRPTSYILNIDTQEPREVNVPFEYDDFFSEIIEAMACLREGKIESEKMPFQSSLNCARIIDKLKSNIS